MKNYTATFTNPMGNKLTISRDNPVEIHARYLDEKASFNWGRGYIVDNTTGVICMHFARWTDDDGLVHSSLYEDGDFLLEVESWWN